MSDRRWELVGGLNAGIRATTLAAKFLLTLFLARTVGAEEVGIYGLMVSSIGVGLTVLGLEFYQHTMREIVGAPPELQARRLRDQAIFHGVLYLLAMPVLAGLAAVGAVPLALLPWFLTLLVLENLAQEIGRALITLGRSTLANVLLFFRGGAWVYAMLAGALLGHRVTNLLPVWIGWSAGTSTAVLIGGVALTSLPWATVRGTPIDWAWIRRGALVSARLAMATAAVVALPASGRFALKVFAGTASVGYFTFFSSIASLVQTFVEAAVTSIRYPAYLAAFQRGGPLAAAREERQMARAMVVVTSILVVGATTAGWLVLPRMVGSEYTAHLGSFAVLLLAYGALIAGWLPQFRLFAHHRDDRILIASIGGLVLTGALQWLLVPRWGVSGAAWATLVGAVALTLLRLVFSRAIARE